LAKKQRALPDAITFAQTDEQRVNVRAKGVKDRS